jgi:hypothetical protein
VIQSACKDIIKCGPISQRGIAAALEKAGREGASIMAKFTPDQLLSRVEYERKKRVLYENILSQTSSLQ